MAQAERLLQSASPSNIDAANVHLRQAIELCGGWPENRGPETPAQVHQLRARLFRIGHLLEGAAAFYAGWSRLAVSETAGYGPDGALPALDAAPARGSGLEVSG